MATVVVVLVVLAPGCKARNKNAAPPAGESQPTLRDEASQMAEIAAQSSSNRHEARARRAKKLAEKAKTKRARHRRALRAARHFDAAALAAAEAESHVQSEAEQKPDEPKVAPVAAAPPVAATQTENPPEPDRATPPDGEAKAGGELSPQDAPAPKAGDSAAKTVKPEAEPND